MMMALMMLRMIPILSNGCSRHYYFLKRGDFKVTTADLERLICHALIEQLPLSCLRQHLVDLEKFLVGVPDG